MQVEGQIRTKGPAEAVLTKLADEATLRAIAPRGFEFRSVIGGRADFVIRRGFGPIVLTLQGHLTLSPDDEPGAWWLEVKAAHLIGGSVNVNLQATTTPDDEGQERLGWSGKLVATGLAGRLAKDYQDRANEIMTNLFLILREHVEGPAEAA